MEFNETKFNKIKEIIKNINDIISFIFKDVFLKTIELLLPIIDKIIWLIIKNLIIILIFSITSSLSLYYFQPSLFNFIFFKLGIDLSDLDIFSENIIQKKELLIKENMIKELINDKSRLEIEVEKIKSNREGLLESIKNIKFENINWWNVILTISGVTITGGLFFYFILYSDNGGDYIKPVINNIANQSKNITELISKNDLVINQNIKSLLSRIEQLDIRIIEIQNAVDVIKERK